MSAGASTRPTLTLSYAQTLDGRLATRNGSSQWIGSAASLTFAHTLRARHDAIMVGVGTVLRDNPRLTVRHVAGRDPLRVVVDSTLRTPLTAAVLADGAAHGTLFAVTERTSLQQVDHVRKLGATVLLGLNRLWALDLRFCRRKVDRGQHSTYCKTVAAEPDFGCVEAIDDCRCEKHAYHYRRHHKISLAAVEFGSLGFAFDQFVKHVNFLLF